jgi:RHS repeat-associated protein
MMALDNLILRDRGSERFYSLQDVFSCTAIADTTGTIQERYGYNAFGLSRVMDASFDVVSSSSYDWETRYDNYRFDSESNFYQVRNRYLHSTLGRWLARDPIEYDGGINLYAYVKNAAVNLVDPNGLGQICGNYCGGNYCGGKPTPGKKPCDYTCPTCGPTDPLDACCQAHDKCYDCVENKTHCIPGTVTTKKRQCDDALCKCVKAVKKLPKKTKSNCKACGNISRHAVQIWACGLTHIYHRK